MNWYDFNPFESTIKKYIFEMIKEKYVLHEKMVDKICKDIKDKDDAQKFVDLLGEIFKKGYIIAIEQQKESLSKVGMELKVLPPTNNENKIFKKNRDGLERE